MSAEPSSATKSSSTGQREAANAAASRRSVPSTCTTRSKAACCTSSGRCAEASCRLGEHTRASRRDGYPTARLGRRARSAGAIIHCRDETLSARCTELIPQQWWNADLLGARCWCQPALQAADVQHQVRAEVVAECIGDVVAQLSLPTPLVSQEVLLMSGQKAGHAG